jgi:hypothetical protein
MIKNIINITNSTNMAYNEDLIEELQHYQWAFKVLTNERSLLNPLEEKDEIQRLDNEIKIFENKIIEMRDLIITREEEHDLLYGEGYVDSDGYSISYDSDD